MLVCVMAAVLHLAAQRTPPSQARPLQAALDVAREETAAPGVAAAIVLDGTLVWEGASGRMERSTPRSVDTETLFVLASLSKPVTAAMVMYLRDHGRLTLDDPLSKTIPTLPNASRITIRMLLNHTSGLGDYEDSPTVD